ncbi:MAG: ATP-binding protein [Gemmatimonadota bacterium]
MSPHGRSPLRRVCVIGPECTGKTTLAQQLAELADTECVFEAARAYAERVRRPLTESDVEPIAREHMAEANAAARRARARQRPTMVLDTDLMSTVVYARHYYGTAPDWLEREAIVRRAHVYLLCAVDLPWEPDGIRDRPTQREGMFELFRDELVMRGAEYVIIQGSGDARLTAAASVLEEIGAAR